MIIAYDLRFASDHFAGIGTHAFCLLEALLALDGPERYVVLWNPSLEQTRHDFTHIADHPRVEWVERRWRPLAPADLFPLGAWLRRRSPTLYLSPYFLHPVGGGCPSVLTIHDVWPLRMRAGLTPLGHLLYRGSLTWARRARLILTSSEFSRREIVDLVGLAEERVAAIPLGVPPRRAGAMSERPRMLPEGPFALVIGDNRPRKNLEVLTRAWAALGPSPPLRLVSAGRPDQRFPSIAMLAKTNAAHDVTELGWVLEAELEWLYGNAQMVLFPSRYEGFGFPLVEAFDRGLPVVAADTETFREVAGDAALLVDAERPADWAAAVTRVSAEPGLSTRLRLAGRARAAELTYERTAVATRALLRSIAAG